MKKLYLVLIFFAVVTIAKAQNGVGTIPPPTAGYDSTYNLACAHKFLIPEVVINGDYVGTWIKTYTWRSGNAISFSIEKNFNNAFSINATSGLITVTDATKINGKVVVADTIINLIIRSKDDMMGYELDTAYVRVKEEKNCHFFDYAYSGIESATGTRAQPRNEFTDLGGPIPGHAYFFKRGGSASNRYYKYHNIVATPDNPTVFGSYGQGENFVFTNDGLGGEEGAICFGNTAGPWQNAYIYNLDVKEYPHSAYKIFTGTKNAGIYNCKFTHNILVGYTADLADVYFYGSLQNQSDTTLASIHGLEMRNCESTNSWGPIVKCDATGLNVYNLKVAPSWGTTEAKNFGIRIGTHYSSATHCLIIGTTRGFQMRYPYCSMTDIIVEGATSYGFLAILDATYSDVQAYKGKLNNILFRRCGVGIQFYHGMDYFEIRNCLFDRCNNGIYYHNTGTVSSFAKNNIIERCAMVGITNYGIYFENSSGAKPKDWEYRYVTIKSGNAAIYSNAGTSSDGLKFYNCTFDGTVALANATNSVAKNCFYKTTLSGITTATNNINIASIVPANYFIDYTNANFRLKSTATLAIDAGASLGITPDIIGTFVPYNSITDIGAFEYQGSGSSLLLGLEEYYNFNETSGQLLDVEPTNPINSTSVSATQGVAGIFGACYSFNGSTNRVTLPDHANWTIDPTTNLSISAWLNLSGQITANGYGTIFGVQNGPKFFLQYVSAGSYIIGWYCGNAFKRTDPLPFALNTWYHVVLTKSGNILTFYRNGVVVGSAIANDSNINPLAMYIGGNTYSTPEAFNGKIDELGVWKKVLTTTEISSLYNNGNGSTYPWNSTLKSAQINNDTTEVKKIGFIDINNEAIYPNPAKGVLYLKDLKGLYNTSVEVYDLKGKVFIQKVIHENSLDVSPLIKGIYFIKLTDAKGTRVYKFIKD